MIQLVLGTHNAKKLRELRELIPQDFLELLTLAEIPQAMEVSETGATFTENAALKATQQALHLGMWVLAEDSGLCVDTLAGAPGVFSARFSSENGGDQANNDKLLHELRGFTADRRGAHYECHVCLADPNGVIRLERSGKCFGRIIDSPRGGAGFGYDPLFEVVEYHKTFAELGGAVKRAISHRARALRAFLPPMLQILRSRDMK